MGKWKCEICNSEFDNYQAQGFNEIIYCPLCYFKELYKREKNKNDKALEYIDRMTRGIDYNDDEFITWEHIIEIENILRGEDNESN